VFGRKASRPLRQLFSEAFQHLIVNTDVFPDPEEVNAEGSLSAEALDHLIFDELVLAFIIIRLEVGAKQQFKGNLVHVHEEFFAGLVDALDKFKDMLPAQSFLEAVGAYEKVLDFEADITDQLLSCYKVFSSRLDNSEPGYSSLLTLVKFIRLHVAQPLVKSAESQFKFE
jgi:hypothetical protein